MEKKKCPICGEETEELIVCTVCGQEVCPNCIEDGTCISCLDDIEDEDDEEDIENEDDEDDEEDEGILDEDDE